MSIVEPAQIVGVSGQIALALADAQHHGGLVSGHTELLQALLGGQDHRRGLRGQQLRSVARIGKKADFAFTGILQSFCTRDHSRGISAQFRISNLGQCRKAQSSEAHAVTLSRH